MNRLVLASTAALLALTAAPAFAQDLGPICTDRPTKANSTCVVPTGKVQLEADIGNYTRNTSGGVRSETTYFTNPTIKYGLADGFDLQLNMSPRIEAKTTDLTTGAKSKMSGVGDLYVRLKGKVLANDTASVSLIPFVKAPIAKSGLGNDQWEGGVAAPISFNLPSKFILTFGPELDAIADADGAGTHPQLINLINLARPLNDRITVYAELWNAQNYDPLGTVRQSSADAAITYLVTPTVQLDVGANFGLNRNTPDAQVYVGLSSRF